MLFSTCERRFRPFLASRYRSPVPRPFSRAVFAFGRENTAFFMCARPFLGVFQHLGREVGEWRHGPFWPRRSRGSQKRAVFTSLPAERGDFPCRGARRHVHVGRCVSRPDPIFFARFGRYPQPPSPPAVFGAFDVLAFPMWARPSLLGTWPRLRTRVLGPSLAPGAGTLTEHAGART